VYFHDAAGLRHLPARWTDVAPEDPFVVIARGRSHFRLDDLRQLIELVRFLRTTDGHHTTITLPGGVTWPPPRAILTHAAQGAGLLDFYAPQVQPAMTADDRSQGGGGLNRRLSIDIGR
jgi:hypothetical protein